MIIFLYLLDFISWGRVPDEWLKYGVLMDDRMKEEVIIDEKVDHHHKCYFSTCGPWIIGTQVLVVIYLIIKKMWAIL
jgi:hypothetical protein